MYNFTLSGKAEEQLLWSLADCICGHLEVSSDVFDAVKRRDAAYLATRVFSYGSDEVLTNLIADRQICALFSKNPSVELGVPREEVALRTWRDSEARVLLTNRKFSTLRGDTLSPRLIISVEKMRRFIRSVLGKCPSVGELSFNFGPGATTTTKKSESSPCFKMANGFSCSERLLRSGLLPSLLREFPHWTFAVGSQYYVDPDGWFCESVPVRIDASKTVFVPKDCKTDRPICVEPTLNGLLQQGIRHWMERRMLRYGLQLSDQSVNRSRAREGSITGNIATIDLSSASDLISTSLCRLVLPEDWFFLLDSARTQETEVAGETVMQEKFCSMGNATTFPLESLLFASICHASDIPLGQFSVFGDDICIPTTHYDAVTWLLDECGFIPNLKKSFATGYFRESCGGDYYKGIDIRPVYFRRLPGSADILTLYAFHNNLLRKNLDFLCKEVIKAIPRKLRHYGPSRLGDGVLHSENYPYNWVPGLYCRSIKVLANEPRRKISPYPGDYVSPLYHIYVSDGSGNTRPKGDISGRSIWDVPGSGKVVLMKVYMS